MSDSAASLPGTNSFLNTNLDTNSLASTKLVGVVAVTPAGVIGRDGGMPWRLSSDLRRFKRTTMGGVLLMGRKTFESIGRPLPGRQTIVITRQSGWTHSGVHVVADPDAGVSLGRTLAVAESPATGKATQGDLPGQACGRVFLVGGAEIYRQLLDQCDEVWLTRVWSAVVGDTSLRFDPRASVPGRPGFRLAELLRVPASAKDSAATEFQRFVRCVADPAKT